MDLQNKNDTKIYIPVIDGLRGLAALMVCLHHYVCTVTGYVKDEMILSIFEWGKFGVDIFFVISGIVIPLSMINGAYKLSDWRKFMSKRILRIEPPYLISIVLYCAYLFVRNYVPGSSPVDLTPSIPQVLLHIGYLIPLFPQYTWITSTYWTLCIEFQFYLFLSIGIFWLTSTKNWQRYAFYVICFSAPFLVQSYDKFALMPAWLPLFMMGMVYINWLAGKIDKWEYMGVSLLSLVLIWFKVRYPAAIMACSALAIIHFFPLYKNKVTRFLGNISYSLYLLHGVTGGIVINFLSHRLTLPYQKFLVIVGGTIISIVCSYLFYLWVEKPSKRWAANIKY